MFSSDFRMTNLRMRSYRLLFKECAKIETLSLEKLFCFSVFGFDIGKLLFELGLLLALGWVHEVEPVAESDGWLDCGREVSSSSGSYYDTSAHIGVVVMVVVFKSVA